MTKKRLRIRSEAREEIVAGFEFYFQRNPVIADAFLRAIDFALDRIMTHPKTHSSFTKNTRRCLLERFPYAIIFREEVDTILVIAVAHGKRRPAYWASRI